MPVARVPTSPAATPAHGDHDVDQNLERGLDQELAAQLGAAISRFVRVARRVKMEAASRSDQVELSAFPLLVALAESGPMRANALAGAVFSDPSTVSRQIAALVAAGDVERQTDPDDRRASLLDLTAAGHATLAAHRRVRNEHIARVTAHWPIRDRRQIAVLVDRLAADFATHLQPSAEPAAHHQVPARQELS